MNLYIMGYFIPMIYMLIGYVYVTQDNKHKFLNFKNDLLLLLHMNVCIFVPTETIRRYQMSWNWSFRACELPCWCWELNLSPLRDQQGFLTDAPSLEPPILLFLRQFSLCSHCLAWAMQDTM